MTDAAAAHTRASAPAEDPPKRRWWAAGLLSLLAPGLGHAYGGRLGRGIVVFVGMNLLGLGILALRVYFSLDRGGDGPAVRWDRLGLRVE